MNVYVVMESTRIDTPFATIYIRSAMFIYALHEDAIKRVAQLEKDRDDELMPNIVGYYYTIKEVL